MGYGLPPYFALQTPGRCILLQWLRSSRVSNEVMGHFKENVLPRGSPYVKESVDQCCGAFLCWSEKLCEMECKGQPLAV